MPLNVENLSTARRGAVAATQRARADHRWWLTIEKSKLSFPPPYHDTKRPIAPEAA